MGNREKWMVSDGSPPPMCMAVAPARVAACVPPIEGGYMMTPWCHLSSGHTGPHVCGEYKWAQEEMREIVVGRVYVVPGKGPMLVVKVTDNVASLLTCGNLSYTAYTQSLRPCSSYLFNKFLEEHRARGLDCKNSLCWCHQVLGNPASFSNETVEIDD